MHRCNYLDSCLSIFQPLDNHESKLNGVNFRLPKNIFFLSTMEEQLSRPFSLFKGKRTRFKMPWAKQAVNIYSKRISNMGRKN